MCRTGTHLRNREACNTIERLPRISGKTGRNKYSQNVSKSILEEHLTKACVSLGNEPLFFFPLLPQFLLFVFGVYLSFSTDWFSFGMRLALSLVTLLLFCFSSSWYSRNLLIGSLLLLLGIGLGKMNQRLTEKALPSIKYNQRPETPLNLYWSNGFALLLITISHHTN